MRLYPIVIATFLVLAGTATAAEYKIGVSPLVIELGEIEPGSSHVITFYVLTQSKDDVLINLEVDPGTTEFFKKPGYENLLINYSEQDTRDWVEFLQNPVVLKYSPIETNGGIYSWRRVNFLLHVPDDAEPGYHVIKVRPSPVIATGLGSGAQIVTVTALSILFSIPGDAIRDGKILDVVNRDNGGDRVELNTVFENSGTVTISARASDIDIPGVKDDLTSSLDYVKPGEVVVLRTFIDNDEIQEGEYDVSSEVDFKTGYDTKLATFSISKPSKKRQTEEKEVPSNEYFNFIIILVIIAVAVLIYKKER